MRYLATLGFVFVTTLAFGQWANNPDNINKNKFRQLDMELPTPNVYRTASGAPGPQYWQQRADYVIDVTLDDERQRITGRETITYSNNSPDVLNYLWLQLDQQIHRPGSDAQKTETGTLSDRMALTRLRNEMAADTFQGGFNITELTDAKGQKLPYTIVNTMLRVDLPAPLLPNQKFIFNVAWNYNINNRSVISDRGGFEYFAEDGNYLYTVTQWYPRMAVYSDNLGWIHKQFYGRGEFTLPFGTFRVRMTVPADHMVGATGQLQNKDKVLTATQLERWAKAQTSFDKPVIIVTQDEATKNESSRSKETKTWEFLAENVRDFAWTSSRKFIWDAMAVDIAGRKVMAMSYYTRHGNPLWEQYSTKVVAHTLKVYSAHTIPYPYPVAISVDGENGMEYPMICFNYGRPEKDGTYSDRIKYGMIGVIIHEVGHNFFPMIVNSDERNWTWMDEGLNTFCEFLAEVAWEKGYPVRRGIPEFIVPYMKGDKTKDNPIMQQSDEILQFGPNAYSKPATALNILRETVMGRELFDHAFKTYAQRWAFKHPTPADFFRTMEDASGMDLDWFWRGWFYTTDHCDISLENIAYYQPKQDPATEKAIAKADADATPPHPTTAFQKQSTTAVDQDPTLADFYNRYDPFKAQPWEVEAHTKYLEGLTPEERRVYEKAAKKHFYQLDFKNVGGLVMPIILQLNYEDGTSEVLRIPAEIWRYNNESFSKTLTLDKPLASVVLDPLKETADTDLANNYFPRQEVKSRFELFKSQQGGRGGGGRNLMQLDRQYNGGGAPSGTGSGSNN